MRWKNTYRNTNKDADTNTNTDVKFDKMGQESEEGEVGKARSCLLANTRITVGYTEKI